MNISILHPYGLVCLTALIGFACSSDPPASGSPTAGSNSGASTTGTPDLYCDPTPFMAEACSGVVCHGAPGTPPLHGTDLFNAAPGQTLAQTLVGKPANYALIPNQTTCPTATPEQLVNPSAPAESLILKKVMGTQACGLQMPNVENTVLTQAEIDCLASWINGLIVESGGTVTNGTTSTTSTTSTSTTGTTGAAATTTGGLGPIPPATWATVELVLTGNSLNCASSDCHGGVEYRIDFRADNMVPPEVGPLYERVTTWTSDLCGKPLVTPGNPEQSALIDVLETGCGDVTKPNCLVGTECIPRMPYNCQEGFDCITPEYIEAIRQWITAGAPAATAG